MEGHAKTERSIGLLGATSIGVGAIVGGGILALAGVAFAATGPSALLAFALNGLLAFVTALSFAELATAFPESGGTYTFAKKVLSVDAAFAVGWIVWFASIAAGALYAVGFGYFASVLADYWVNVYWGHSLPWLTGRTAACGFAVGATAFYTVRMIRRPGGGAGHWENAGKLAVFAVLIAAGLWALTGRSSQAVQASLSPFFSAGATGLFQAMGFTFIALQGFDLIAAAAGEIRDPARTIPRAMLASLGIALLVYLPLLLVIATAGVDPGESIARASAADPEGVVATAASNFLGPFGYWLVIVAAILSMLSALRANLFAASRVALTMARDRTLPRALSAHHRVLGTPMAAVLATAVLVAAIVVSAPGVAAAGAASSLIFLISFAVAHWISILARRRSGAGGVALRFAGFPLVPAVGTAACLVLAVYQGVMVPRAGFVAATWLGIGGILFLGLFARPARVVDASVEAQDPNVVRLRGRNPLMLVPIANPFNAESMIAVAGALAPPEVGKVLLLSVAVRPPGWQPGGSILTIRHAQMVLGDAMTAAAKSGLFPEALATVAPHPWPEIARIAREHRCEGVVLGFSKLKPDAIQAPLDDLVGSVGCDVVIVRAGEGWQLSQAKKILVPVGGQGGHETLRARLLGSLFRTGDREVCFLHVMPENTSEADCLRATRQLQRIARDEAPGRSRVEVVRNNSPVDVVSRYACQSDLVILGLRRVGRRGRVLGDFALGVARNTSSPTIMISRPG